MLDAQARARNVTAIIASGWVATTGLMAVHASHQLDETEQMTVCWLFDHSPGDHFSPNNASPECVKQGRLKQAGT
ncbi:MAG: hypothetical protein WAV05_15890 [Anaerolineales bacterium]